MKCVVFNLRMLRIKKRRLYKREYQIISCKKRMKENLDRWNLYKNNKKISSTLNDNDIFVLRYKTKTHLVELVDTLFPFVKLIFESKIKSKFHLDL